MPSSSPPGATWPSLTRPRSARCWSEAVTPSGLLQWLCSADVAVEPGRAVYTAMLNSRGGYESDLTVTRLDPDEFLLVTSSGSVVRGPGLDQPPHQARRPGRRRGRVVGVRRLRRDGPEVAPPAVDAVAVGPLQRGLPVRRPAGRSTSATPRCGPPGSPTSESWVGSCTSRPSSRSGCTSCWCPRGAISGWSTPGYYAINSLRLEKGYRAWGSDLTPDYTPVEAGLLFTCKLKTDIDFLGRPAVEKVRAEGPQAPAGVVGGRRSRRRCCGAASSWRATAWRSARSPRRRGARPSAPVWRWPTSGDPTALRSPPSILTQRRLPGRCRPGSATRSTVHLRAPYDPSNERVRGLSASQGRGRPASGAESMVCLGPVNQFLTETCQ